MYKLTTCRCGMDIMQEGCCGNETILYQCPCGENYLEELTNKNKNKVKKAMNTKDSQGDKKCHS